MRIDKYLKVSRILKRRTIAKELADNQRLMINERIAKAGSEVSIGDILTITFGKRILKIKITEIREFTKKEDSESMYEVIGESIKE